MNTLIWEYIKSRRSDYLTCNCEIKGCILIHYYWIVLYENISDVNNIME